MVVFKTRKSYYSADVLIGNRDSGRIFYDIVDIQPITIEESNGNILDAINSKPQDKSVLSGHNISNTTKDVNKNDSTESPKKSARTDDSLSTRFILATTLMGTPE